MKKIKLIPTVFLLIILINSSYGQVSFEENQNKAVFSWGELKEWDDGTVWFPSVVKDDDTLRMWYTGYDKPVHYSPDCKIGYAWSLDGISWNRYEGNPVLEAEFAWEQPNLSFCAVIQDVDTFKMWYGAASPDGSGPTIIGYATSTNGRNWTKYQDPVLKPGQSGDWDDDGITPATIIKEAGEYKMWYTGHRYGFPFESAKPQTGLATSIDGIHWTKYNDTTTTAKPYIQSDPVLKVGGKSEWDSQRSAYANVLATEAGYKLWYQGLTAPINSSTLCQIGHATSTDGISWVKCPENPIFKDNQETVSWGRAYYTGTVLHYENFYHMWFACFHTTMKGKPQIGYATSPSNDKAQFPEFTRIDTGTLVDETVRGRGMYPVDIDNDGDLDLYIGNSTTAGSGGKNRPNLLYRNDRNFRFEKISKGVIAESVYETNPGSNWGDADNDGDWDLYNHGELFLNDGFGNFEKSKKKISSLKEYGATWIDYNNDSFLDIFTNVFRTGNFMRKNNGDNTFSKVDIGHSTNEFIGRSQSTSWSDCDNDGDLDYFEANFGIFWPSLGMPPNNRLFINNGDGNFSPISSDSPIVSDGLGASGGAWGDYDNDGDMDIYVFSVMQSPNYLYRNDGDLNFERIIIEPTGCEKKFTYSGTWGDFNNDGYLDLFVGVVPASTVLGKNCTFKQNLFFINNGDGSFSRKTTGNIITDGAQALAANDIDNDGDLDLVITHGNLAPPYLTYIYSNHGNDNNWLNFSCEGTHSNRSAIGVRIRVKAQIDDKKIWMIRELTQENGLHSCNGPRLHFGLGDAEIADSIVIRWPSGHVDTYLDVPKNQFYRAIEDSTLNIDFRATSYIQLSPDITNINTVVLNTSEDIDLNEYYKLIIGDTVPDISGDTLNFELPPIQNQEILDADLNGSLLTVTGLKKGLFTMPVIASAGFTKRMGRLKFVVEPPSSIHSEIAEESILIYPNPASDKIYINAGINDEYLVEITAINGQLKYKSIMDSPLVDIDISTLQSGIYFVTVTSKDKLRTQKIIKY